MNTIAVYPGSFDPITNGHLDIIARAVAVFDEVVIGVLANPRKTPLLPVETRIAIIREALADSAGPLLDHVRVEAFDGLTVEFCRAQRREGDRPRAARDQRLRVRDAARPQQPRPRPRGRHRVLHDLGRERLRQLEPGQGDRGVRRGRLGHGPAGCPPRRSRRQSGGR